MARTKGATNKTVREIEAEAKRLAEKKATRSLGVTRRTSRRSTRRSIS